MFLNPMSATSQNSAAGNSSNASANSAANVTLYECSGCSTCKSAVKWLKNEGLTFETKPIVERPPTLTELKAMLEIQKGQIRKLFNTSGLLYREMRVGEKLSTMSTDEALNLLVKNGKLVKRPFAIARNPAGKTIGLLGFKEPEWKEAFEAMKQ